MFCMHCEAQIADCDKFCSACGQAQTNISLQSSAEEPQEKPKAVKKKKKARRVWLIAVLCVVSLPLLYLAGVHIYNNSGIYQIDDNSITYHGTLEKLVKDDYSLLREFVKKSEDDGKRRYYIECNDFELWIYPFRRGGLSEYVYGDTVTVFEEGLVEGPDPKKSAGLYRNDFEFEIEDQRPSDWRDYHTYYFCSVDDALKWLKRLEFLED